MVGVVMAAKAALVAAFGIVLGNFSARAASPTHLTIDGSRLHIGKSYEDEYYYEPRVQTGLAVLIESGCAAIRGRKVAVVTNPSGVTPDLRLGVDVLVEGVAGKRSGAGSIVAVLGPEHGFRGIAPAGKSQKFFIDDRTGLPVYDIYAKSGQALADILDNANGADTVLFDIQDIGARFYTYIWTLHDVLQAALISRNITKEFQVIVLDRPNPLGGRIVDGPVLKRGFESFVGRRPIPLQHGMTVGELASLFFYEWLTQEHSGGSINVDLQVVKMKGWGRHMIWPDCGLPWVPTSPNMPSFATAMVYPGLALIEGTNVSEGRGTTTPFSMIGAPFIRETKKYSDSLAYALSKDPNANRGARFREAFFIPNTSKFANQTCGGIQVYVDSPTTFSSIRTGVALIVHLNKKYKEFSFLRTNFIDLLYGSDMLRTKVSSGASPESIFMSWQNDLTWFQPLRSKYLLYQ